MTKPDLAMLHRVDQAAHVFHKLRTQGLLEIYEHGFCTKDAQTLATLSTYANVPYFRLRNKIYFDAEQLMGAPEYEEACVSVSDDDSMW